MRNYLTHLLYICITISQVHSQDCPWGWASKRNDKTWPCYLFTHKILRTWTAAQTFCEQMGGGLLHINSLDEKNWAFNVLKTYQGYYPTHTEWWIGLHDNPAQTGQMWVDRSVPNPQLLQWVPGEPATYDRTNACVEYYNGSLRHQSCSSPQYFVCERARENAVFCDARDKWESINQKCYKVVTKLRTWDDARGECQAENADLIAVSNLEEENILYNFIESRQTDMWIGLRAYKLSGSTRFRWQGQNGLVLKDMGTFWETHTTSSALQTVLSSNGTESCVIANHTLGSLNAWQPADCAIKSFSLCEKGRGTCASGWIRNGQYCYSIQIRTKMTWPQADKFCKDRGAYLLYISTALKQQFINKILPNLHSQGIDSIWLGISDDNNDAGPWKWSYDVPLSIDTYHYNNFNGQTPVNRPGVLDCFNMFTDDINGTWQVAADCNANKTFMCTIPFNTSPKIPTTVSPSVSGPTTPLPTLPTVAWASDCGPFWVKDNVTGYCYQFTDYDVTWMQAKQRCANMGAQLASINTYHDQRFIADRLFGYKSDKLWIGVNDLNSNRGFHWIDGSAFAYFNWAPGEPNNFRSNEECGEIFTSGVKMGQWNDNNCNRQSGYICKKKSSDFATLPPPTIPSIPAGKIFSCPNSLWLSYKNTCFLIMKTRTNWNNAGQFCKSHGVVLASIADENEYNFVFSQLPVVSGYRDQFWIGLNDRDMQMTFKWSDSTPVGFTNWAEHEPNNWQNRREDCVTMYQRTGQWNDEICDNPQSGFLCKTQKAILPSNTPQHANAQKCPTGQLAYGYKCYRIVSSPSNRYSAIRQCRANRGTLASIHDKYQQAFLASQIAGMSGNFWIGLSSSADGTLSWSDSATSVDFTAWSANHTGNENGTCVAMRTTSPGVGLWQNSPCSARAGYICETVRSGFSTPRIVTTTTPSLLQCPYNWHGYNGYCYKGYTSSSDRKPWLAARDMCRAMGADLVSLHSSGEETFAFSHSVLSTFFFHSISNVKSFWIGLNDFDTEKGFKWSDGTALNYTNWGTGEPNDASGTDDCVEYNKYGYSWNDNNCYLAKAFVCKIKKGINLISTVPTPPPTQPEQSVTSVGVSNTLTSACGDLPGWELYNNTCYYMSPKYGDNSRLSWFDALDFCHRQGADLASIHSDPENGFIVTLISLNIQADLWIGLTDVGVNQFGWSDGTTVDYVKWSGNEPNDAFGNEKCALIAETNGFWNDNNCNEPYHFVCKRQQGDVIPITVPPTKLIPGGCPDGFKGVIRGNKCFKVVGTRDISKRLSYTSARDTCRKMGSGYDIASIGSHQEQASILSILDGQMLDDSAVWIGLNDLNGNSQYTWQDGSRFTIANWDKGQPQQNGGKCVEMYTDTRHAGRWHTVSCRSVNAYICQTLRSTAIALTTPPPMCSVQGYSSNGLDCYKVQQPVMKWADAKLSCESDGPGFHLASILSVYEQAYIDMITSYLKTPVWIGLADPGLTGTYSWVDNYNVAYTSWDMGEPTYTTGEGCIVTFHGLWNDTMCNKQYPSVCKKSFFMPPTATGYPSGYCKDVTWKQFGDYCYFVNLKDVKTYAAAEADCEGRGMELASIHSVTEEGFILQTVDRDIADSRDVWIGFRRKGGFFSWSDNTPTSYVHWDGPSSYNCGIMQYSNGKWKSVSCTALNGYVCKTPKLPATSPPPTTTTQSTTTQPTTSVPTSTPTISTAAALSSKTLSTISTMEPVTSSILGGATLATKKTSKPRSTLNTKSSGTATTPQGQTMSTFNIPTPQLQLQKQESQADLSGGQVIGVVVGTLLVITVVCGVLLLIKHRSGGQMFSFQKLKNENTPGFDNAAYDKTMDSVNINGNGVSNGKFSSISNGFRMGFTEDNEEHDA